MSETTTSITSAHLRNERTLWIHPPADPNTAKYLTVLLDGELYRERIKAEEIIAQLRGTLADAWFVFVSMHSVDARWLECPCHLPFARFVVEELLPELRVRYPAMQAVQHRIIAGLSYTGLAAAFIAREYPAAFSKVISQSGSFWWKDGWLVEQYEQLSTALPTAFYLDVGTRETQENVRHKEDVLQVVSQIDGVRGFRDALLQRGHSVKYVEFDGGHEFPGWAQMLPAALKWALPGKGYQGNY